MSQKSSLNASKLTGGGQALKRAVTGTGDKSINRTLSLHLVEKKKERCLCCRKKFSELPEEKRKERIRYLWQVARNHVYMNAIWRKFVDNDSDVSVSSYEESEFSSDEEFEMAQSEAQQELKWYIINPTTIPA